MISGQTIRDLRAAGVLLRNARAAEQEAAFATVELQLRALLASPELAAVLASHVDPTSPRRQEARRAAPGEVVLVDSGEVRASLGVEPASEQLHTLAVRGVYCVLSNEPAILRRYHLPAQWRSDMFIEGTCLRNLHELQLCKGAMLRVDGAREVLQFRTSAPLVLAKLVVPLNVVQRWVFDPRTLRALRAECADARIDAQRHAVEVLRTMGVAHSTNGLLCMTHHRAHFVRWEGIRALMYVDREAGLQRLQAAVADHHPDVRIAAAAALERLERREREASWPSP